VCATTIYPSEDYLAIRLAVYSRMMLDRGLQFGIIAGSWKKLSLLPMRIAFGNSGLRWPGGKRITIIWPATMFERKGPGFDLPIASGNAETGRKQWVT
jgi:hypothetical protein